MSQVPNDGNFDDEIAGFEIPDDLSSLAEAAKPKIEVVLTQVATADALAAACALHKFDVLAVSTPVGAYAVVQDGSGVAIAQALSSTVAGVPLLLLVSRAGKMDATRWEDGAKAADVPAALVLGGGAPAELEGLLLGTHTVADLTGAVDSRSISKWKAIRLLSAQAKGKKA